MYQIQTDDFYQDTSKDVRKRFDTSDYPEKHSLGTKTGINKKVIGKFRDEAAGKQITHFVGLRAKLYSYKWALVDCASIILSIIQQNEHYFKLLFQFSTASIIRAFMR